MKIVRNKELDMIERQVLDAARTQILERLAALTPKQQETYLKIFKHAAPPGSTLEEVVSHLKRDDVAHSLRIIAGTEAKLAGETKP